MRVVGHIGGGEVMRPDGARSVREMRWRAHAEAALEPLVCGPSFLALLAVFPRGQLPPETACAIAEALVPPADGTASLVRLRFDLDDRVFRWCARPAHGADHAFAPWRAAVIARLLGRHGPRFETMFARREPAEQPIDMDELPWSDVEGGRCHLAGIVSSSMADTLAASHALREQWFMHDGPPPEPLDPKGDELRAKAEALFIEAEHDCFDGRISAAAMNLKLATIYHPQDARYRRAARAITL